MKSEIKNIRVKRELKTNNKFKVSTTKRFLAYLIDNIVLALLYAIPMNYIYSLITKKIEKKITLDMFELSYALIIFTICLFISFYYLIYIPVYKSPGKTIGKRAFGIKVVKEDGSNPDFKTMFIREAIGVILLEGATYPISGYAYNLVGMLTEPNIEKILTYIFGIITAISVMYALINKNNAMFHDRIAKTKVISIKN